MSVNDILSGMSDGVRDTPAQSLNGTYNPVTNILRFINCDPVTGAYTNTTAFAQQSCTSATGFPAGDKFYNNFNNLMRCACCEPSDDLALLSCSPLLACHLAVTCSYGDKSCLRTITPGQAARARCAIKCMWRQEC